MHSWFMVCLSTSSLSRDLLLAGQASAAKGHFAGPRCVHGLLQKDLLHVCWRQLGNRQKKVAAYAVSSVYVGGGFTVGNPTKKKGENLSDVPHLAQGFFV